MTRQKKITQRSLYPENDPLEFSLDAYLTLLSERQMR